MPKKKLRTYPQIVFELLKNDIALSASNQQEADMAQKSWEFSDDFWSKVKPLIEKPRRDPNKTYGSPTIAILTF